MTNETRTNNEDTPVTTGGQEQQANCRADEVFPENNTEVEAEAKSGGDSVASEQGRQTKDSIDGLSGEEERAIVVGLNKEEEIRIAILNLPPSSVNNSRTIVMKMIDKYYQEGGEILRQEIKNIIGVDLGSVLPSEPF